MHGALSAFFQRKKPPEGRLLPRVSPSPAVGDKERAAHDQEENRHRGHDEQQQFKDLHIEVALQRLGGVGEHRAGAHRPAKGLSPWGKSPAAPCFPPAECGTITHAIA